MNTSELQSANLAEIVHRAEGILIVDGAHGAHFGFDPFFPESPVRQGADLIIQSLHKTLPALTQTALLHVNGTRVDRSVEMCIRDSMCCIRCVLTHV